MKKSLFALAAAAVLLLQGCGDVPVNKSVPDAVQRVSIPVFENRTVQPNLESDLTRKVVQDFISDGRVQVVPKEQADAELRGIVQRYDRIVLLRDANQVPQEYKLQIVVDLDFVNVKDGKDTPLWTTRQLLEPGKEDFDSTNVRSVKEYTNYYVLNVAGVPPEDEPAALDRLLTQASSRILRRTLDGF
jgi:hypothetical protein